jgi:hypothetical protein
MHSQRVLRDPAGKRRKRGRGLSGQPHFVDALHLLEITVGATGQGREILERWTGDAGPDHAPAEPAARPLTGPGGEPVAPFEAAEAEEVETEAQGELELDLGGGDGKPGADGASGRPEGASGRRRRRRGGRRRRRRGAAGEGAPPAAGGDSGGAPAGGEPTP